MTALIHWLPVKAILFYALLLRALVAVFILAAFWPDDDCTLREGLVRSATDFGLWLGHWPWSRHPGKRAKRGKGRRGVRNPAGAAA